MNQIVKATCLCFAQIIPPSKAWDEERRLIQIALDTLRRVNEREPTGQDFFLDETVSLRLRGNYEGLLRVYQLLLTGEGIAFTF